MSISILDRIRFPPRLLAAVHKLSNGSTRPRPVPVKKILMGGEGDVRAKQYAMLTGDLRRPSTATEQGPHFDLIKTALSWSDADFESEKLRQTAYYKNARNCMRVFGDYFPYVTTEQKISLAAKRFIYQARGQSIADLPSDGHSKHGESILLHPIKHSDCYEILQGNHRVAFAMNDRRENIDAVVLPDADTTPIQDMLGNVLWDSGEKLLYQPLDLPELAKEWTLLRECETRFKLMHTHLNSSSISLENKTTLLDVGSYFGWFVSRFANAGIDSYGIERDQIASRIGEIAYRNTQGRIIWDDAFLYLSKRVNECEPYDIVSCLSVMHHMVTGREKRDAIEFLKLLERSTKKILFFEMGESHEKWFGNSLTGWDADHIENWILKNTDFKHAVRLGRDVDATGAFKDNFGRMLFAFHK